MLADWARKNSDLPDSCACCSNGKGENSAIERTCCGCFTVKVASYNFIRVQEVYTVNVQI